VLLCGHLAAASHAATTYRQQHPLPTFPKWHTCSCRYGNREWLRSGAVIMPGCSHSELQHKALECARGQGGGAEKA